MNKKRIVFHAVLLVASIGVFLQQMATRSRAQEKSSDEQPIRMSASTVEFKPSENILKGGVPVTLDLVSQDPHYGLMLAEFHFRADIDPGILEKIRFVQAKVSDLNRPTCASPDVHRAYGIHPPPVLK